MLVPEAAMIELHGEYPYRDILVYEDTLVHAVEILKMEVLPIFGRIVSNKMAAFSASRARQMG